MHQMKVVEIFSKWRFWKLCHWNLWWLGVNVYGKRHTL